MPPSLTRLAISIDRARRLLNSLVWHYTILGALVVEFVAHAVVVLELEPSFSTWATFPCVLLTSIDTIARCMVFQHAVRSSHLAVADAMLWGCMVVVWMSRVWMNDGVEGTAGAATAADTRIVVLVSVALTALRLVLHPRARRSTNAWKQQHVVADFGATNVTPTVARPRQTGPVQPASHFHPTAAHAAPKTQQRGVLSPVYSTTEVIQSTFSHWATLKSDIVWCILVMAVNAAINPLQAYCLQHLLDKAFPSSTSPSDPQAALQRGMAGLIVLCVPFGVSTVGIGVLQSRMLARATARLHSQLLHVVLAQPATYFVHDAHVGDATNVFASDVARVNALWQGVFWNLLHPALVAAAGFGYLLACDFSTGWLALWVAVVIVSSGPQGRAAAQSTEFGSANAALTASFQDTLSGHATVVAYDMQPSIQAKFDADVHALASIQFAKDLWATLVQIYVEGAMYMFVAVVTAGLATRVVATHTLTPGAFVSYVALLGRVSSPITVLGGFMRVAIGNSSSLQRVDALLALGCERAALAHHTKASASTSTSATSSRPLQFALTVAHLCVQVSSPSVVVVSDVSFACPRGSLTCIVGPSGSGKTSVLRSLMQTGPPPAKGAIWWDDVALSLAHRPHVGVVFQHPRFLRGTIRDNLCYGHTTATDADCHDAIAMAHCLDFVNGLPHGLDTDMASVQWSGGQLQRLSLARALVRRPSVLLLDEATSALDQEAEAAVVATLTWLAKTKGVVVIAVTHRLATTKAADLIVVLLAGRVAESGCHGDLMRRRGVFYDLARENYASAMPTNDACDCASVPSEEGDQDDDGVDERSDDGDAYMVL